MKLETLKKIKNKQGGFTIIETLVALVVISLVLGGFINLVVLSMRTFETSELRYTAAKIAQEGMEFAVNKRDNHIICVESGSCPISNWQDNLVGSWQVDSSETNRLEPQLRFRDFDANNTITILTNPPKDVGKYGYGGTPVAGNPVREVRITSIASDKILVQSIVTWKGRLTTNQLVLEEVLFGLP